MPAGWKPNQLKISCVSSSSAVTFVNKRWAVEVFTVLVFLLVGGLVPSRAASPELPPISPGRYTIDPARSRMTAFVRSTLHDFDTKIPKFTGTMVLPNNGELSFVQFHLSFPTADMSTGNSLRDDVMHSQALEVEKYPQATFDATTIQLIRRSGEKWEYKISGVLSLHGVKKELSVPIIAWMEKKDLIASATFPFLLSSHKISPPGLLFVKVEDEVKVSIQLAFRPE